MQRGCDQGYQKILAMWRSKVMVEIDVLSNDEREYHEDGGICREIFGTWTSILLVGWGVNWQFFVSKNGACSLCPFYHT